MMRERLLTVVEFEGSPGVVSKVVSLPTCPGTEMFAFGKLKVGELNTSSAFNWYSTRHRSVILNSLMRLAFCTLSPGHYRTLIPALPNRPGGGAANAEASNHLATVRWSGGRLPLAMRSGRPPDVFVFDGSEPEKLGVK